MELDQIQKWLYATSETPKAPKEHNLNNPDNQNNQNNKNSIDKKYDKDNYYGDRNSSGAGNTPKRRRLNPVTPPSSETLRCHVMASPARSDAASSSNSNKRPLEEETPRAKRRAHAPSISHHSQDSLASDQSPTPSSQRSGRVSTKEQRRWLQLNPRGLVMRALDYFENMPPDLAALVRDVEALSEGRGILAKDMQAALTKAAESDARFLWALQADRFTDDTATARCTPTPEEVCQVVEAAIECDTYGYPEATWNLEVHQSILRMAFRPGGTRRFKYLVNFMGSATASIMREYGIPTVTKKVDFCVYIKPDNDPQLSPAFRAGVSRAQAALPHSIVGFTDFEPLYDRFVALSIETKKPSENAEVAQLQLGVWDMAHWAFLRRLEALQSVKGGSTTDDATRVDVIIDGIVTTNYTRSAAAKLPTFLPGIFIHGHLWHLVFTTMDGDRTVLWRKMTIGATENTKGVYQIVSVLQRLAQWSHDVHWPCLQAIVEAIPEVQEA
ncbi:hypothetical protein ARSEF4850_010079 [Beauveria asiatica]